MGGIDQGSAVGLRHVRLRVTRQRIAVFRRLPSSARCDMMEPAVPFGVVVRTVEIDQITVGLRQRNAAVHPHVTDGQEEVPRSVRWDFDLRFITFGANRSSMVVGDVQVSTMGLRFTSYHE